MKDLEKLNQLFSRQSYANVYIERSSAPSNTNSVIYMVGDLIPLSSLVINIYNYSKSHHEYIRSKLSSANICNLKEDRSSFVSRLTYRIIDDLRYITYNSDDFPTIVSSSARALASEMSRNCDIRAISIYKNRNYRHTFNHIDLTRQNSKVEFKAAMNDAESYGTYSYQYAGYNYNRHGFNARTGDNEFVITKSMMLELGLESMFTDDTEVVPIFYPMIDRAYVNDYVANLVESEYLSNYKCIPKHVHNPKWFTMYHQKPNTSCKEILDEYNKRVATFKNLGVKMIELEKGSPMSTILPILEVEEVKLNPKYTGGLNTYGTQLKTHIQSLLSEVNR